MNQLELKSTVAQQTEPFTDVTNGIQVATNPTQTEYIRVFPGSWNGNGYFKYRHWSSYKSIAHFAIEIAVVRSPFYRNRFTSAGTHLHCSRTFIQQ